LTLQPHIDFSYHNKAVKGQDKRAKLALDSLILDSFGMIKGCKGKELHGK